MNSSDCLRRSFSLPSEDVKHLNARGLPWETINVGSGQWLLIHCFPVPDGYNTNEVTVAIQIPLNYPTAQLDMVYFSPPLSRVDGKAIPATQHLRTIDGRVFQRWSRHRTVQHPWRPGIDNISTHLGLVEEWLERELQ